MNWVSIVIGVIFLGFILIGWGQGMLRVIISAAGLIASVLISLYVAPYVSGYIQENTKMDEKIAKYISHQLEYTEEGKEISKGLQVEVINSLPLPETLKDTILDNNNTEMYDALKVTGVYDYIAMSIAVVILNATVFLVLSVICRILVWLLLMRTSNLTKLPIIRSIDKIGGGALGGLKGLIWIWIFFLFLSITSAFDWSQMIILQINESYILKMLYDNNIFVEILSDLTKVLFL